MQINDETGEVITFESICAAARAVDGHVGNIGTIIHKLEDGGTYRGFRWERVHQEEESKIIDIPNERWLPVKYKKMETNYEVSNAGRVRNKSTKYILAGCLRTGYLSVNLHLNKQRTLNIHRLVAEAFLTGNNKGRVVNHRDRNRLNNSVDNLEWVTMQANIAHAVGSKVNQVDPKNMSIIHTFNSMAEAARVAGVHRDTFKYHLKRNQMCAGFLWQKLN